MNGLPILTYHSLDHSGSVISTTPEWFDQTLASLHADEFRCVDLLEWVNAGRPTIERGFAITFDDGLASLRFAAKSISRFGFCATAFLVSGRMGHDSAWPGQPAQIPVSRLLNWNDLDDLRASGFRFGAHTGTHPHLGRLDPTAVRWEIIDSRLAVEQRTGEPCRLFAYPYGDAPKVAREIVSHEFDAGFGTRLAYATVSDDRACISRVDSFYLRTPTALRRLLTETWTTKIRVIRAARATKRLFAIA